MPIAVPSIWNRACDDSIAAVRPKTPEKLGTALAVVVVGGLAGQVTTGNWKIAVAAAFAVPLTLAFLTFLWKLLLAPRRVTTDLTNQVNETEKQREAAVKGAVATAGQLAERDAALAVLTKDRDGWKRNWEEIHVPQVADLEAKIEKYRTDATGEIATVREVANDLAIRVHDALVVISQSKENRFPEFTKWGLPQAAQQRREWHAVGFLLTVLWSACDEYQREYEKQFPRSPPPGRVIRTYNSMVWAPEALAPSEGRVEKAVKEVQAAIRTIRDRAEAKYNAYVSMDSALKS